MDEWRGETGALRAQPGDRVMATDGEVGEVIEMADHVVTGPGPMLLVRLEDGSVVEVPETLVTNRQDGIVYLPIARETLRGESVAATEFGGGDVQRLLLHEETLEAATAPVKRGTVRVVRRVETVPVQEVIDAWRDDVVVERVAVNQEVDVAPAPRTEGDTIVVPVVEEIVVSETRLVVREEVRITRRRISEPVTVEATVRRERVDVVHNPEAGQAAAEVLRDAGHTGTSTGS
jgi:uncharacterized protein (TIGR02271 family)